MAIEVPKGISTVKAALGSALELVVPSKGSSGFRWEARPVEGVEIERLPSRPATSFGGASRDLFRVIPQRAGSITLRLELRAPWVSAAVEVRTLIVNIV